MQCGMFKDCCALHTSSCFSGFCSSPWLAVYQISSTFGFSVKLPSPHFSWMLKQQQQNDNAIMDARWWSVHQFGILHRLSDSKVCSSRGEFCAGLALYVMLEHHCH